MKTSKFVTIFSMLLVVILCCVVSVLGSITAFTVNKDNTVTDIDVDAVRRETEEDAPPPFPIHCRGNWSKYSPCVDGETSREFEVTQEPNETGVPCPSPLTKTYPCEASEKQHCLGAWRDFGECQYTGVEKVYGTRAQSYKVIKPKRPEESEEMRECRDGGLTGDIVEDGDVKMTPCEKPCSDDEKVGRVGDINAWGDDVIIARCQKCTGQSEDNCRQWLYPTCEIEVAEHNDGEGDRSGWKGGEGWGKTGGDVIMRGRITSYRTKGPWSCRYKAYQRSLDHEAGSGETVMLTPNTVSDRWNHWRTVPDGWNDDIGAVQITGGGRRRFSAIQPSDDSDD